MYPIINDKNVYRSMIEVVMKYFTKEMLNFIYYHVIGDIDLSLMPYRGNGIDKLRWIRDNYPEKITYEFFEDVLNSNNLEVIEDMLSWIEHYNSDCTLIKAMDITMRDIDWEDGTYYRPKPARIVWDKLKNDLENYEKY